jgi:hypothetical protein
MTTALKLRPAPSAPLDNPELRRRIGLLIERLGGENDGEVLNAARAISSALGSAKTDVFALSEFMQAAQLPELPGGPTSKLMERLLAQVAAKFWVLRTTELETLSDLQKRFAANGRLASADIALLDQMHREVLRRV